MGEVYRARDSKLKREVAIKVLPAGVAGDPERLARFQREAEVLASLNHPNIAHIYGIEDGALVMELVEGEDLSQRIARGPIPIDEALPIAKQIAEALEAAHESGIIHRDLKPANIKVRGNDTVKVLDFGLAKALEPAAASREPGAGHTLTNSPTMTSPAMTMRGVILGTAAYMSPEQARGKGLDRRADIWSFGCVLYEMLTGRKPFDGETITDILGAVVRAEPDWHALPSSTPVGVRRLLQRCLQKDPVRRLRHIGDALTELEPDAYDISTVTTPVGGVSRRGWAAGLTVAAVIGAILVAIPVFRNVPAAPPRVQKLHVNIDADGGTFREAVISPDGTRIAYVGRTRIWVRELDEWTPRELTGTEAAMRPFWSPDSTWIGYFRAEALLKVPAEGGPVVRVTTLPAVQATLGVASAVWTESGTIYISLGVGPLLRVAAGGGDAKAFLDPSRVTDLEFAGISRLPGRDAFLIVVRGASRGIGVLSNGEIRMVLPVDEARRPRYAAGYIVFERRTPNAGLWAAAFSIDTLTVTGEPFLIGEGVEPSMADDGTLCYIASPETVTRRLAWFSMEGAAGASLAEPREWIEGVALSRDQRRLLASAADGLWMYDVETGARSRITTDSSDITPDWVDDTTIVFVRTQSGQPSVVIKRLGSDGDERVIARGARFPRSTANGRRIGFNLHDPAAGPGGSWRVAWVERDAPATIHTLPPVHNGARFPSISPDGTLVAYVSGEMGRDEIFLTSLPAGDGKWQLSADGGGGWTLFHPQGNAVFYRALDGSFMSVPIAGGTAIKVGQPRKLFDWGPMWAPFYEVARDGRRGVAAVPVEQLTRSSRLSIVRNWPREFAAR